MELNVGRDDAQLAEVAADEADAAAEDESAGTATDTGVSAVPVKLSRDNRLLLSPFKRPFSLPALAPSTGKISSDTKTHFRTALATDLVREWKRIV